MMNGTLLNNDKDPLGHTETATRELFKRMGAECNAFPNEAVVGAAANLLLNAIRQSHKTRRGAETAFDELVGTLKGVLLSHYDGVTDQRRNIFPYHQIIEMPHTNFRQKFPQ